MMCLNAQEEAILEEVTEMMTRIDQINAKINGTSRKELVNSLKESLNKYRCPNFNQKVPKQ